MRISVGIDIAKETHWVIAIAADSTPHIDRKLHAFRTDFKLAA